MSIYFLLFGLAILFFIILFLFKRDRIESKDINTNNNKNLVQNIDLAFNSIESNNLIEAIIDYPIKKQNTFLNPNDDFGTLKKGVVLDNQTYEYEINENDSSNLTIIELGDETKEIGE
jgi:hypothetical protein